MKITGIKARQIFDSRGLPTIETDLTLNNSYFGRASIPSGASKGMHEALELRDGDEGYHGKSVLKAVNLINEELGPHMLNFSFQSQEELDQFLIDLDGTVNKSALGANTILSISIAFAKARASVMGKHLFQTLTTNNRFTLPKPMLNIINGGVHADNGLDIQEFMIVPVKYTDINQNLKVACEIFHSLRGILKIGGYKVNTGDEGGFAPDIKSTNAALDLIVQAIEVAGYKLEKDVCLALDVAANELYQNGRYQLKSEGVQLTNLELIKFYEELCSKYPIISIEDPLSETDLEGWKMITQRLGQKIKIVGDDLFVTNPKKLQQGIDEHLANAILIKINQIGTMTETLKSIDLAASNNFTNIISHRSGETEDTTIAHLAVATSSQYIKTGSISRTDRVCKYNELMRIEEIVKHQ
ncbi:phosphopyruvate hydratase [Candidatus Bandiella euplotis]|uniref:Enolase n=1 Tax=Candidatus Bandiella euplotis TaxID=1664265 RepID=A0ABZ0UNL4_9RICK|nr:phosphopyruvate hydratase [Candidatus Bandiella woodruffii]WPX96856.1 Enolase [Candidatus Bandiella woodruffii]